MNRDRLREWRTRKEKLQICTVLSAIYIKYVDLRNTSKATFWSEPCTPDLHSKGKQHSNMWETESKSGCGRKKRSRLSWVTLFLQQGDQTVIWSNTGPRGRSHLGSIGCKQDSAKLIRLNKTCSHLFCDNRLILMCMGGKGWSSKQRVGQEKERSWVGEAVVSVGEVYKRG